jgi:hypothetical protein
VLAAFAICVSAAIPKSAAASSKAVKYKVFRNFVFSAIFYIL